MSIKSELQEILEPYRNGGDYEDFEMLTQAILDLLDKRLEEMFDRQTYENKESRKYFQPSYVPQRAHKNGYKLAVRELRANVRKVIKEELK